jgi:hypothetical protein
MTFKPFHKPMIAKPRRQNSTDNWREKVLVEYVRRVKEREDSEYSDVFGIFNKIVMATVEKLSKDAIGYINKRDEEFRLRIATLLFDKAITNHGFAAVMAECARIMVSEIPDMKDDIQAQISMFPTLYNINETITFPTSQDADFDNKVIAWMKQKEKRRGYAKFVMELCLRDLVTTECVRDGLKDVIRELMEIAKQPRTSQTEENVGQFATFLYETANLAKKNVELKTFLCDELKTVLAIDRSSMPSLNMKSRFKLEDAFKCVQ